jgi:hypothetical protein
MARGRPFHPFRDELLPGFAKVAAFILAVFALLLLCGVNP